jgi:pimeloyl-ACP methyl ester carboxylesterase
MKRLLSCLAAAACGPSAPVAAPSPAPPQTIVAPAPTPDAGAPPAATPEARASELLGAFGNNDFDAVEATFDPDVATALPKDKITALWKQVQGTAGAFRSCDAPRRKSAKPGQPTIVVVPCRFAKGVLDVVVALDDKLRVAGLHLTPHESALPWSPPPYAAAAAHTRELLVGDLGGTLTVPGGAGPVPCVVLVHGSGPNDRDETIGPNKVFADLSAGLAGHRIATLRYDKRTRVKAETLPKELTVEDETIKDAVIAVEVCAAQPEIDHKRVYVLGHSLGAYVGPRIAKQSKDLAGLILLAAPTRDLADLMVDQLTYLAADAKTIEDAKAGAKRVHELQAGAASVPGETDLGVPASYWKDLAKYDPTALAASLAVPILVGQGGRDYQVSATLDFPAWQKALGSKPHDKLVVWPKLNHLLIAGEGPSKPAEYERPDHVDELVIRDVADFIAPTNAKGR